MTHSFLSDDWMSAARAIREKYAAEAAKITVSLRINQTITGVPFGDGTIYAFMDTSSGALNTDLGVLENPDATIITDYDTMRKLLIDQDQAATMQAFMGGKIKVEGDMMKIMGMQTAMPQDAIAIKIAAEIKEITT